VHGQDTYDIFWDDYKAFVPSVLTELQNALQGKTEQTVLLVR